ncbi:MAG: hypothetical protein KAS72_07825 [Phycisphaerales bacterium]|nr:hypothetical protein [Phycisphaerales bacterium]
MQQDIQTNGFVSLIPIGPGAYALDVKADSHVATIIGKIDTPADLGFDPFDLRKADGGKVFGDDFGRPRTIGNIIRHYAGVLGTDQDIPAGEPGIIRPGTLHDDFDHATDWTTAVMLTYTDLVWEGWAFTASGIQPFRFELKAA